MSGFSAGPAIGIWTPTLIGSVTPGTGQTYNVQTGSYEVIGRLVVARFNVNASSLGTAAGNLQIGGLPFPAGELSHVFIPGYTVTGLQASTFGAFGTISATASVIVLLSNGNTANAVITVTQAGNTPFFQGTAIYRT